MEQENVSPLNSVSPEKEGIKKIKRKKGFSFILFSKLILIAILVFASYQFGLLGGNLDFSKESVLNDSEIRNIINSMVSKSENVSVKEIAQEGDLFRIVLLFDGEQELEGYLSKDGKKFFSQVVDVEKAQKQVAEAEEAERKQKEMQEKEMVKSEKPEVELFVMSHCPYGTQMEKGFLPVVNAFGDKIDFKVKFVYYAMHGKVEVDEQLNQYCIQKEEPEKFMGYLKCFLEEGKTDDCMKRENIDILKNKGCTEKTDDEFKITEQFNDEGSWISGRFSPFDIYKNENEKYGVQGSPTLVINGKKIDSKRDPKSILESVCSAFSDKPEECFLELPSVPASAGFGFDKEGNATEASCG